MTDINHNMTITGLNFGRCTREENQPGRAASPQAAVHLALNIPHSDGEYARQAQANGALGTERPTRPGNTQGRAASPQAAVHLALNIHYTGCGRYRPVGANGALGTERPTQRVDTQGGDAKKGDNHK